MPIVYLITNTITGKRYVGKTVKPLAYRWRDHNYNAERGKGHALHAAIRKHGKEGFQVSILEECATDGEVMAAERSWIAKLGTLVPRGYNIALGGEGPSGWAMPEETKRKISEANRGKIRTPEALAKMSAAQTGRRHPEDVKAKIAAGNAGKVVTAESCARIAAAAIGRRGTPHTEEWKRARSEAMMGVKRDPAIFAKISAALKGRPNPRKGKTATAEQCARMREAHRGLPGHAQTDATKEKIRAANEGRKRTPEQIAKITAAARARYARQRAEREAASAAANTSLVEQHLLTL